MVLDVSEHFTLGAAQLLTEWGIWRNTRFDVLVINLAGSDERLESVRHMLDREQVAWRRMPAVDGHHGMPEGDYDYDEAAAIIRHDRP